MITWGLAPPIISLLTFDIDFCPVVPCFRIDNIIVFYSIFRSNQRSLPFVIEADFALNAYESAENLNVFLLFRSRVQVVFLSRRGRRMKISRKKRGKYYLATNIFFKMTGSYKKIKCTSFHLKKKLIPLLRCSRLSVSYFSLCPRLTCYQHEPPALARVTH